MDFQYEHQELERRFAAFFTGRDYRRLDGVAITSGVDPSVYLTNSATNLFKPHIGQPDVRLFAMQRSMRTQNLNDYYSERTETEYPTCFTSYGAYASIDRFQTLAVDSVEFFLSIGFQTANMRVRVCPTDSLLFAAISNSALKDRLEVDSRPEKYGHQYGSELTGRAIKIDCFQEWGKKYKNLAYILIICRDGVPAGAELATSDQLILMRLYNRRYAVSASKIADMLPMETFAQRRFADSIVGASNLLYEGVRPNSSNTNGRTLKKYLQALKYFGTLLCYSEQDCADLIDTYITKEYGKEQTPYKRPEK